MLTIWTVGPSASGPWKRVLSDLTSTGKIGFTQDKHSQNSVHANAVEAGQLSG